VAEFFPQIGFFGPLRVLLLVQYGIVDPCQSCTPAMGLVLCLTFASSLGFKRIFKNSFIWLVPSLALIIKNSPEFFHLQSRGCWYLFRVPFSICIWTTLAIRQVKVPFCHDGLSASGLFFHYVRRRTYVKVSYGLKGRLSLMSDSMSFLFLFLLGTILSLNHQFALLKMSSDTSAAAVVHAQPSASSTNADSSTPSASLFIAM
jgi:hypothetical protein